MSVGILIGMSTTIKVPSELRDRLAEHARDERTTLAEVIRRCLDAAEAAAFWDDVRATMGPVGAQSSLAADVERLAGSMSDGLDPDEDWSDLL